MKIDHVLKPIFSRKLNNGEWLILADETAPLIVEEELAKSLVKGSISLHDYDVEVLNALKENNFYTTSTDQQNLPLEEKNNLKWRTFRYILFCIGITSILLTTILTFYNGIPNGDVLTSNSVPLILTIVYALVFSIITTILHELMHIIFSRSYKLKAGGLRFQFIKSTVTVSMTHIWVWSFFSRLAALSAGLIFDFFLLASLSIINHLITNWMITIAISILWLRIIWQFRFHKNCDGQLIILSVFDNPMLIVPEENKSKKEIRLWISLKMIGYIVELFIIIYWLIPLIWSVFQKLS